jgi:hypothetical protein
MDFFWVGVSGMAALALIFFLLQKGFLLCRNATLPSFLERSLYAIARRDPIGVVVYAYHKVEIIIDDIRPVFRQPPVGTPIPERRQRFLIIQE